MLRSSFGALLLLALIIVVPQRAAAGGTEFPADGVRNLGRGGAGMASADDPYVMVRNPARLADLWDDQAMLGAHFLLADSCFQPTGAYGAGTDADEVIKVGDQILLNKPPMDTFDPQGNPLVTYTDSNGTPLGDLDIQDEPYPQVCYEGPMPFLPHLALSMKPSGDLGVGLGFFPPDTAALNQWGNPDGTVDTANGLRPNPLRYYRSHLNTSYFSVLAAVGYRLADWIRIGAGFQWQLAVFQARTWSTALTGLNPRNDVKTEVFGRDLFIPGFTASAHIKPMDALDIAVGFRWSDSVSAKSKLDLTSGPWGTGERYAYQRTEGGEVTTEYLATRFPSTSYNQAALVESGPVWVPQLSVGVRYADRLKPLIKDAEWDKAHASAGGVVEDSMQTERWNVEADVVYYFTSVFERTRVTLNDAELQLRTINKENVLEWQTATPGDCYPTVDNCKERRINTEIGGKNQLTGRIGAEYNLLPGFFTVRAGASYEADGQDPEFLNVQQYMYGRIGMHGGLTVRLAKKTDINVGFAHFVQKEISLQINEASSGAHNFYYRQDPEKYHYTPGALGDEPINALDGMAGVEIGNAAQEVPGPYFVNAGSYYYHLSVLSLEFIQHF